MTKVTHGTITVTNDLTEAHVFPSYVQAAEFALMSDLPLAHRIEDRTNPVTGAEAATISIPGLVNQWIAAPDMEDTPEPANSDEEPDQLAPGD